MKNKQITKKKLSLEPENLSPDISFVAKRKITIVKDYLSSKYLFRKDVISNELQYTIKPNIDNWKVLNENDILIDIEENLTTLSDAKLRALLSSSFVPPYNPILEYFENLPKTKGTKNIDALISCVKCPDADRFKIHFKKMLVRMIACSLGKKFNKQAFILVGGQNTGKSSFIRFLCPPTLQMTETFNPDDKDALISLSRYFIINLDELASLSKKDVNKIKSLISSDNIKVRKPYERKEENLKRIANFLGSTNQKEFLTDETGSVRFLCFEIDKIDFSYSKIDIDLVYSEAYNLFLTGFDYGLTANEVKENEELNKNFVLSTIELDLVRKHCKKVNQEEYIYFKTTTEILDTLQEKYPRFRLNLVTLGKALSFCLFERKSIKGGYKGYYLEIY